MSKLILASASPRRKQILRQVGLNFQIKTSNIDESSIPFENPKNLVGKLSLLKAKAFEKEKNAIILAADTIVVFENEIIGKPKDGKDAKRILKLLSGKVHSVITGFTLFDTKTGKTITKRKVTKVWFKKLSDEEIDSYVRMGEPQDKAGAYGIQEKGAIFVEKIQGCYFNVVGLPVCAVVSELQRFGVLPF